MKTTLALFLALFALNASALTRPELLANQKQQRTELKQKQMAERAALREQHRQESKQLTLDLRAAKKQSK